MNDLRGGTLQWLALLTCLLATAPSAATAQAEQACTAGTISEITFDRQKPFNPVANSENSTLVGRILYTAGSRMDRPFQLTLRGREAVRSYDDDAFPGAKRLLATLEQRIPFPGLDLSFLDLGLAGFVDAGKVWGGSVPYGADSKWEAGVGLGIRIGLPAGGQNVLRTDLALPVTGQREEKGVVFRLYPSVP